MNWVAIFYRLFEIINTGGDTYLSGTQFLNFVRGVDDGTPYYQAFIDLRRDQGKSTSRRDYYYDLLMEQTEANRVQVVTSILDSVGHHLPEKTEALKALLEVPGPEGPQADIPDELWNSERLVEYLERMDTSIAEENYELTLTLCYTCLEGFYKSFIHEKIPDKAELDDLTRMAVEIRNFIKAQLDENDIDYPELVVTLISTVTNALCNARNGFSDSHSGNRAEKWLAIYLRDNVNSIVKMILNFI